MKITAADLYKQVREWAWYRGIHIFTWEQYEAALFNYVTLAAKNN